MKKLTQKFAAKKKKKVKSLHYSDFNTCHNPGNKIKRLFFFVFNVYNYYSVNFIILTMVLISDDNSEHIAHASSKKGLLGGKKNCDCSL